MIATLARFQTNVHPPDAVRVKLFGDDGSEYAISIPTPQISVLLLELMRQCERLPRSEDRQKILSLRLVGAQPVVAEDGRLGLNIFLGNGLNLTLEMPMAAISTLQRQLQKLSQIASLSSRKTH